MTDRPKTPLPAYRVYGLTLESDHRFVTQLTPVSLGGAAPDITFEYASEAPVAANVDDLEQVYASELLVDDGESALSVFLLAGGLLMRFPAIGDYYVLAGRIVCVPQRTAHEGQVEIYLLGSVLSVWLALNGVTALHASCVSVEGRAVGFLAGSQAGKSSLAAAMMAGGHPLIADDILAIERRDGGIVGRPAFPAMRMWTDQAAHFLGEYEHLPRVHPDYEKRRVPVGDDGFGAFADEVQPVVCLYLPERAEPGERQETAIIPVSPREAVIEVLRQVFAVRLEDRLGLGGRRLELVGALARTVPVRRLLYPHGLDRLDEVRDAVLRDLKASCST